MAARTDHVARGLGLAMLMATGAVACKPAFDPDAVDFSDEEWEQLQTHALRDEPPDDPTNDFDLDDDVAILGQGLFYLTTYSGERTGVGEKKDMSCATCHDPAEWFQEVTAERNEDGPQRNFPTLVNTAYYTWYSWDGRRDSLWGQSLFPPEKPMHSDRATVVQRMLERYGTEYREVFGDPGLSATDAALAFPASPLDDPEGNRDAAKDAWEALAPETQEKITDAYVNFGKALAAYQRKLVSRNSPFDRYLDGDEDAIGESAKRGLRLFEFELPCGECHAGPTFTDNAFHNIGTGANSAHQKGRPEGAAIWQNDEFNLLGAHADGQRDDFEAPDPESTADLGKFRTKHLRQVAATPQYMHDGQLRDLELVIDHYRDLGPADVYGELDEAIVDSSLREITAEDRADLIAFLETLTGDPIADELIGPP